MPIRTPRVTLITRREGQRVAFPAGVPVELTNAEIEHLDRDSPGALAPVNPEDPAPASAHNPLVVPVDVADAENPSGETDPGAGQEDDAETEEERLAREAVERAKGGKPAGKAPGKSKGGKPASGDADGL